MKFLQQNEEKFEPIAIVLETRDEANIFWAMISDAALQGSEKTYEMAIKISDYFSEARL